ncbi:hypothetical protein, unlikely [Trypanosoma brucei brucei TREU927]|uniref:Uncharacterized protein n=1 Tax=Trypanosoma brucei brucei (strain 927/4 GUTat10.1) TaxID=185431 RepID=Q38FJ9_TRYB2|nr:hypothetical protein, unlikely [Trypanosoma brucei brucei TREU927]EAN76421.1 hypothetical protein, unlikely [Trypanosoma brucei brucei TREU927]
MTTRKKDCTLPNKAHRTMSQRSYSLTTASTGIKCTDLGNTSPPHCPPPPNTHAPPPAITCDCVPTADSPPQSLCAIHTPGWTAIKRVFRHRRHRAPSY